MVDGPCGLESLVVVLMLHISLFGIFEGAIREGGSGVADAFFDCREMEIDWHNGEIRAFAAKCWTIVQLQLQSVGCSYSLTCKRIYIDFSN